MPEMVLPPFFIAPAKNQCYYCPALRFLSSIKEVCTNIMTPSATLSHEALQERKRINKAKNYAERALHSPCIESLPLVAKIEVTNRCNLHCIMCREQQHHEAIRDLDLDVFQKLEPIFPTLLSAYLYGIGEVLTYPHVMEMFDMLHHYAVNVGLITNGLLIKPDMAEEWVKRGLYKLSISIDGATKETYESIRRGASFEALLENITLINELKKKYNTRWPRLTFNFVSMKDTIRELPMLVDLAAEYGAEEVIVSDLIVFFDELKKQVLNYDDPLCQEYFARSYQRAVQQGVALYLPVPFLFQKKHKNSAHSSNTDCPQSTIINPCTEPWSGFWLTGDGVVTPCCYWMNPMGNLHNKEFTEIWNNKKYQHLRSIVNTADRHQQCRQCAIAGMERRQS